MMANRTITSRPHSPLVFSKTDTLKNRTPKPKSSRQIKVRKSYYPENTQSSNTHSLNPPVPQLAIKGYWLQQAGFCIGMALDIEVADGCLVIRPRGGVV